MNPLIFSTIISTLMLGTLLVIISSHWLLTWIGLEMNLFAIIPLIIKSHNPRSIEAATKYFMNQASASMLLMMAILVNFMNSGQWTMTNLENTAASYLAFTALIMKLGMAPFHFWVPETLQGSPLSSGILILTWQKLAPLCILYMISPFINHYLVMITAMMSIFIGGWGGLNQTQLRKIMAYSSIAHMGWMTAIIIFNPTMTLLNLIIYIITTLTMFILLIKTTSTTLLSMSTNWNKFPLLMTLTSMTLLSMGGLPPFSGFIPKWLIIQELIKNNNIILSLIMALAALLNLFFYLRITYSTTLTMFPSTNSTKHSWLLNKTNNLLNLPTLTILSIMLLPLTPILLFMD
uniref:NADH-ubiquinone oxidoreductase chain 2 n=5 Tax=Rhynchocyon TaxID=151030 RepID=A0A3Q9E443_9EUTH|nr:NADH dehydrogenase subunit 2 [Rhynchocyon udzungwensis]